MAAIVVCLLLATCICCYPTGVQCALVGSSNTTTITPSVTIASTVGSSSVAPSYTTPTDSPSPSLTPSPSPSLSPSPTPSPSLSPSPTPSSSPFPTPFLEYVLNDTLYIRIEKMVIYIYTKPHQTGYYNLTIDDYPEMKSQISRENASLSDKGVLINFWKYYKYNKTHQNNATFFFNFTFELEPTSTDQTWYISSFSHSNRTTPPANGSTTTCKFQYSGLSQAVHAPSDMSYFCSDMTFQGDCVDGIRSEVHFTGLWVQAFQLENRKPSSTYIDCGEKDHNNSIINVVVGSVIGSTLAIALIVILVTLATKLFNRKVRWRGYNILRD